MRFGSGTSLAPPASFRSSGFDRAAIRSIFALAPRARLVVVGLASGGGLVAVELVEELEVISDRLAVAANDRVRRKPQRRHEPRALQLLVVHWGIDDALLQGLADDLADAPVRQPLLARNLRVGPTLAESREDPRAA